MNPHSVTKNSRLAAALAHQEPDRVPFDPGGCAVTGINIGALRRLRVYLNLPGEPQLWDPVTQVVRTGDDVAKRREVDVKCVAPWPPACPGLYRDEGLVGDCYRITDELGIGWRMPRYGGHYYDLYYHPLANAERVQDIDRYAWPDPRAPPASRE